MQIKFRHRFESAHRFVSSCSPKCQTPHGHTWYVHLTLNNKKSQLNQSQMISDFDGLKKNWKEFIDQTLDHSFFYHHKDPIVDAMKEHIPNFRGLPFPGEPTTEMVAVLLLKKAQSLFLNDIANDSIEPVNILIEETPTNSIAVHHTDDLFVNTIESISFSGWWDSAKINNRELFSI